ncbi:MAG TPA: hypothetical protein VIU15_30250 [Streptomyces sp.]
MRYVETTRDPIGFRLDATAYLAVLPALRDRLPPGARAFATAPGHYDIADATHCVKDLEPAAVHLAGDRTGSLVLEFAPNRWKHDTGLRIAYSGVRHFSIDRAQAVDCLPVGTVLLDEILPDDDGCVHEIALTDATITVRCADLQATWG